MSPGSLKRGHWHFCCYFQRFLSICSYYRILAIFPMVYCPPLSLSSTQGSVLQEVQTPGCNIGSLPLLKSFVHPGRLLFRGFACSSVGKESACSAGDPGSIPGLGRSPGVGHGNSLQYSCLENPTDRGAWRATVHRVTQSWTQLK